MPFLEELQKKSRKTRVKIMWSAVFACMAVLIFFWSISLNSSMDLASSKESQSEEEKNRLENAKNEALSIKRSLKASIKAFFNENELQEKIEQTKKELEENDIKKEDSLAPSRLPLSE